MHHHRLSTPAKLLLVLVVVAVSTLPLLTGCAFIDQLLGGGVSGGGTGNALKAVITAELDDNWDTTLNPDLRPPLMYDFSAMDSLSEWGEPIEKGSYQMAWAFGDGETRGVEWSDYTTHHRYWDEGTYTATLTLGYGNASDTAQKTITIGPGWLEILSLETELRTDGQFNVAVLVRNQSNQTLNKVGVRLFANGVPVMMLDAILEDETPDRIPPNGTYTLRGAIYPWTGTLTARSSWCLPWQDGQ